MSPSRLALVLAALVLAAVTAGAFAEGTILPNGDLRIPVKEISGKVTFYPYKAGNVLMEVFAVKAPDGSIRTAFNTCQVCYRSGKGYYVQEGNVLVCQNCGSRFALGQVELVKGGCNPLPITKDEKTQDAAYITIPKAVLEGAAPYFLKWKKLQG